MRLKDLTIRLAAFAVAAILCGIGAVYAVAGLERASVSGVEQALEQSDLDFATVIGDGLTIILEGEADSEAERYRARTTAGTVVDQSRVIDNMTTRRREVIAAPEFSMEILRNDAGISIIGLIPARMDREDLTERLATIAGDPDRIADFVETADYAVPELWPEATRYALRVLRELPRSKISVRADAVMIEAIADSDEDRARIESSLARQRPEGVVITTDVRAPRPVVTPYTTRFVIEDGVSRFESCVADTPQAEERILAAARSAGLQGRAGCTIALGAPSANWTRAVEQSINALAEIGSGSVTLSDTDVILVAAAGTVQGNFDRIAGELENSLPEVFALEASIDEAPNATADGPPQFIATRSPEGLVQLRGRVSDDLMNNTAENFARAKFGADVAMGTRVVQGLPPGWAIRVLAGIEALSHLSNGSVVVEPDSVVVRGNSGDEDANAVISSLLTDKLGSGADFTIDVVYVEALDPIAALPSNEECLDQILSATEARKITFDPGSANISGEAIAVVDDIADILRRCADLRIEIAGYTDSQGSEGGNLRLSQQRADAVLDALRVRRVPTSSFRAVGYGEENPIATNETEEGREANRRIEFSLIVPESNEEPTALEQIEQEAAAAEAEATEEEGASE